MAASDVPNRKLSAAQRAKYNRLMRKLKQWETEAARLTPAERIRADADWERMKKSMNEERARAGARPVFAD